jgi:hypothetical protein
MPDTKPKPDDPAEYQRFLDMAREVEAEEDAGAMDRAFENVIPHLPKKIRPGKPT